MTTTAAAARDACAAVDPLQPVYVSLFLASTPLTMVAVYGFGGDRGRFGVYNGIAFSTAFLLMFLSPLVSPLVRAKTPGKRKLVDFRERLKLSIDNWIVWLTCFTQIAIQIPHNIFPKFLWNHRGSIMEWPFYAYGLSDKRWSSYSQDGGDTFRLSEEVALINWNDGLLGVLVFALYIYRKRKLMDGERSSYTSSSVALAIAVVFRDATLWRETVEYLSQHYLSSHKFTTFNPEIRTLAIANVYLINGLWLIAPLLSPVWAWHIIDESMHGSAATSKKGKAQ